MKKISYLLAFVLLISLTAVSCSSDNNHDLPDEPDESAYKYVLMTLSERVVGSKAGFVSAYDEMPSGTVDNVDGNSLQGHNMGGFIPYKNHLYKKYSTDDNSNGIEKIQVGADGKVSIAGFLQTGQGVPGSGNFAIADDNLGFYWDVDKPLEIQKFDPTTLSRTGAIDLTDVVNERGADEAAITFRSIGRKFLVVKEGKLYADLNYANSEGGQQGFWDDFYDDVYIAVIDIATETHEKTIRVENTGSIAYVNENRMYSFDTNGDLYFITQGRSALGGKAKISRIKANASDIDASWELKYSDFNASDEGKFTGVFVKDGIMLVAANTEPLTGGPNGNINSQDIWKLYRVDLNTQQLEAVEGIPAARNQGAAELAVDIDDHIYLRVGTNSGDTNGYFLYDEATNSAQQVFSVDVGGLVSGLYKVKVD